MKNNQEKMKFEALEGVVEELNDPLTDFFVKNNKRLLEKYKLKLRAKSYSEKIEKLEFEEIERTESYAFDGSSITRNRGNIKVSYQRRGRSLWGISYP